MRLILLTGVLFAAFVVRLHRIDSLLWFDEIVGCRLSSLDLEAIILNGWTDPHPPLYYLVQWVVSGFGRASSEIVWRWLSLVSGVLAVAVIGTIERKITTSLLVAFIVCLIATTLPSLVFYSQEARPSGLLVLLASLSMLFITKTTDDHGGGRRLWTGWLVTSLVGMFTGYAYLMVVGIQLAFLGFYHHQRLAWRVNASMVIAALLGLMPFMTSSLPHVAAQHVSSAPLTLGRTMQTLLAGEPLLYGFSISHIVFPVIVLGLYAGAVIRTIRLGDNRLAYCLIQLALPLGVFFTLSPWLGLRLPLAEARQFIVLLPTVLVCLAAGLVEIIFWLGQKKGALVVVALCETLVLLDAVGLQSYWRQPKSPEGLAVIWLRDKWQSGESVVSLHESTSYALGFYTTGMPTYLEPIRWGDSYRYRLISSERIFEMSPSSARFMETEQIRANGRFWGVGSCCCSARTSRIFDFWMSDNRSGNFFYSYLLFRGAEGRMPTMKRQMVLRSSAPCWHKTKSALSPASSLSCICRSV